MARAGGLRAALPFHTARRRGRGSERIQEPGKGHLRVPGAAKKEPDGTQPAPCLRGGAWWAHLEQSSGPSRTATEHRVRHGLSPARPRWTAPRTGARGEKSGRSNRALSHLRPLRARRTDGPAWLAPHTSPGLVWATSARLGTGPSRTLGQILLVARRTTRQTTPQLPGGTARVQNTLVPASEGTSRTCPQAAATPPGRCPGSSETSQRQEEGKDVSGEAEAQSTILAEPSVPAPKSAAHTGPPGAVGHSTPGPMRLLHSQPPWQRQACGLGVLHQTPGVGHGGSRRGGRGSLRPSRTA